MGGQQDDLIASDARRFANFTGIQSAEVGIDDDQVVRVIDRQGREITFTYDGYARLVQRTDGAGNAVVYHYDDTAATNGLFNQPESIDFPTFTRRFTYDVLGRVIQVTDDLQNGDILSRSLAYDQAGRVTAVTDEEGETTRFEYDGLNRLTKTIDPLGNETVYKYDDRGSLIELRDAEGRTTCFEYDRNGRLTRKIRPLLQETGYEYDAAGNLSALADANGRRIEYAYDAVNRLAQTRFYAAGDHTTPVKTVDFTYDELGRLLTWDDGTASGAYTYDNLGRKTTETVNYGPFSLSYSYTYYANGRKKSFTGPDGAEIGYTYDENNRLAGIAIPGQGHITNAYDSAHWNRPAQTMLPGGGQTDFAYDPLLRLKSIAAEDPGDNTVLNRAYDYSPDGDITDKTTEYGDHAYQYDAVDQLLSADNPEDAGLTDEGYTYDAVYNRLTSAGVTGDWSYNDNNELTGYDNVSYEYDANGNMTQKTVGTEITSYEYTVDNRLAKVWDGEAETGTRMAEYGYDPFGRRLWKEVDGTRTCFLYSDEGLIGEYDAAGNEIKTYGWRPGGLWGTNPLFLKQGGTYYWYLNNYQGTPQKLVASSGLVVWEALYDSFGQAQVTESGVTSNLRLPGQYFDAETGLHYNWHRYYDPKIGRYLRTDPAEDGINLYAYCLNDPVNLVDPWGLFIIVVNDAGGRSGPTYGGTITVIGNNGQTVTVSGSSWPNPNNPSPGVSEGTYDAVYSPTGHQGREPGVRVENGSPVPTLGPNPAQNNQPYATGINIHSGYSSTCRGSAGCITIAPNQAEQVWNILQLGETGTVSINRSNNRSKGPCK